MNKSFNKGDKIYYVDVAGLQVKSFIVDDNTTEYMYMIEILVNGCYSYVSKSLCFYEEQDAIKKSTDMIDELIESDKIQMENLQQEFEERISAKQTHINELKKRKEQNLNLLNKE